MGFLQYRVVCSLSMSVLPVLNVNILAVSYRSVLRDRTCLQCHPLKTGMKKKDRGGGGSDYSRVEIISNILTKRLWLFKGGD